VALDSRDQRAAAINVGSPWRGLLPAPDGSVDELDRPQAMFLYRMEADPLVPVVVRIRTKTRAAIDFRRFKEGALRRAKP
jgi:hypothetical protein